MQTERQVGMILKIIFKNEEEVPDAPHFDIGYTFYVDCSYVEFRDERKLGGPCQFIFPAKKEDDGAYIPVSGAWSYIEIDRASGEASIEIEHGDVAYLMENGKTIDTFRI